MLNNNKPIMLSGIQPSNNLTLGNYLGAIKPFVDLQNQYKMYVFIADLHAITNVFDPKKLKENKKNVVCFYYACGLDFEKNIIFNQSDVKSHTELGHVLLCHTTIGELSRMTQFKAKAKAKSSNNTEFIPTGLLTYPTLMAADILLYDANAVIVGYDQRQHLELTRDLATRMNNKYCSKQEPLFVLPEAVIPKTSAKVMDLLDPTIKMSKSNANTNGTIFLTDDEETIMQKILKAKTDSFNQVKYDRQNQPGIANLLEIYSSMSNIKIDELVEKYKNIKNYKQFKIDVANVIIEKLKPIKQRYNEAVNKYSELIEPILQKNAQICTDIVSKKTLEVYKKIGIK